MKTALLAAMALFVVSPSFAQDLKPAKPPEPPKYVDSSKIKAYWFNKMPVPQALAKDYKAQMDARAQLFADIKAGKYDATADRAAAVYNKSLAMQAKDYEAAKIYEAEIVRCEAKLQAEKDAAAAKAAKLAYRSQMQQQQFQLQQLNSTLSQIRNGEW